MQLPKQAGLVVDRRDAPWARCRINPDRAQPRVLLVEAAPERPILAEEAAE